MLCPDCKRSAPGGTACPECGQPVPARESFGGQGGHYLMVLSLVSLLLLASFLLILSRDGGILSAMRWLVRSGWVWPYFVVGLAPMGVGFYYWALLREEEISVTDEYIARRSHWGNERLEWRDVRQFRRIPMLFSETRLGRIAGLSRVLANRRLISQLPPTGYELVGPGDGQGQETIMRLEPGTIEDLPWLLQLIEEHVGPPQEA